MGMRPRKNSSKAAALLTKGIEAHRRARRRFSRQSRSQMEASVRAQLTHVRAADALYAQGERATCTNLQEQLRTRPATPAGRARHAHACRVHGYNSVWLPQVRTVHTCDVFRRDDGARAALQAGPVNTHTHTYGTRT